MHVRVTPGALLLLLVLLFSGSPFFVAAVVAAAWHECGHLLVAALLGIKLRLLELDFCGARLYPRTQIPSYRQEAQLALAGPAASLALGLFLHPFRGIFVEALQMATLSLAVFNLLPIGGFDGGRAFFALLAQLLEERLARRVTELCTYLSLLLLFALSSCVLLRFGQNPALVVFCASLFAEQFLQGRRKGK